MGGVAVGAGTGDPAAAGGRPLPGPHLAARAALGARARRAGRRRRGGLAQPLALGGGRGRRQRAQRADRRRRSTPATAPGPRATSPRSPSPPASPGPPSPACSSTSRRIPRSQRSWSSPLRRTYSRTSGCGRIRNVSSRIACTTGVGHLLRLQHSRQQIVRQRRPLRVRQQHGCLHALRAEARDADAVVPVGHRQELREGHRPVLRHRVGHGPQRRQQSCGRGRAADVALAPLEHVRQHRPRRARRAPSC